MSPALAGRFFTTVLPGKPLEQGFFFKGCDENSLKLDRVMVVQLCECPKTH